MKLPKGKAQVGKRSSNINTWETPTFCLQVEMEDGETNKGGGGLEAVMWEKTSRCLQRSVA